MATTNGTQMAKVLATDGFTKARSNEVTGKVRVFRETVTMASQAAGDIIRVGQLPANSKFLYGVITASATLGATATIKIGTTASDAAFRAAATHTVVVPTLFGTVTGLGLSFTAATDVILTVGAAALPSSGTLYIEIFYSVE